MKIGQLENPRMGAASTGVAMPLYFQKIHSFPREPEGSTSNDYFYILYLVSSYEFF